MKLSTLCRLIIRTLLPACRYGSELCYYMQCREKRFTESFAQPMDAQWTSGLRLQGNNEVFKGYSAGRRRIRWGIGHSYPHERNDTDCSAEDRKLAWELAVIRSHGLDQRANLTIKVIELASPEAGKIALRGGSADVIVSDWLWVSRERELGAKLTFYPYSSALGAVMVPNSSSIRTLADLKGRKLGVAGGPIDKSWLLLRASMKQDGIDLKSESTIVYGAPPLLAAKTLSGEMDATVNFWNFCAALEAKGFRRLAGVEELLPKLGAKGRTAMIGYVFDEGWGAQTVTRLPASSP